MVAPYDNERENFAMARIVLGIATSHGPLLSLDAAQWKDRAAVDYRNDRLNLSDGRWIPYDQLLAEVGGRYESEATIEQFEKKEAASQRALDRIAAELAEAKPDVVVIVGDDQDELFSTSNMPALAIYYGEGSARRNGRSQRRRRPTGWML